MVLVTGASGNVGKAVLSEVARSGARHKAMYRSANEAAKAPTGMETVLADFAKKETLAPAKSASTVSIPVGALAASFAERYIALCLAPPRATSFNTALPTFPLAPVTKIMARLLNR